MSQVHENCPVLLSVIREFGNCDGDLAQDCLLTQVTTCSPFFQWRRFNADDAFQTHSDLVGCYSRVHEINQDTSELVSEKVKTYGLEVAICRDEFEIQRCLNDANARLDLEARATRRIMRSLLLAKEKRIWAEVLNPANFTAGNLTDLTGVEIDAAANATNPLQLIRNIIASTPSARRPNWAIVSKATSEKLIQNKAFLGEGCCNVINPLDVIASLLGLNGICVADAQVDIAGLGLTPDVQGVFNDSILLYKRNDAMEVTDCPTGTFAMEAIYAPTGDVFSAFRLDGPEQTWDMGLYGGTRIKIGYSSAFIYQYDLAHLITNVCV